MLLAFDRTESHGEYAIAAVCSKCYQNDLQTALIAASLLDAAPLFRHTSTTHGVLVWTPDELAFQCRTAPHVYEHLAHGEPLPPVPSFTHRPQPIEPRHQQRNFHYEPPPNANEPADYDPPCPADIEPGRPH